MSSNFNPYECVFRLAFLGLLQMIKTEKITLDQAHWLLLSPSGLARIDKKKHRSIVKLFDDGLLLEDILSISGREKYEKTIIKMENEVIPSFDDLDFEELHVALIVFTGLLDKPVKNLCKP